MESLAFDSSKRPVSQSRYLQPVTNDLHLVLRNDEMGCHRKVCLPIPEHSTRSHGHLAQSTHTITAYSRLLTDG